MGTEPEGKRVGSARQPRNAARIGVALLERRPFVSVFDSRAAETEVGFAGELMRRERERERGDGVLSMAWLAKQWRGAKRRKVPRVGVKSRGTPYD